MTSPLAPASGLDAVKARFQAYVATIPGQTLALFASVLGLAVLNILTLDLVSSALTLDRTVASSSSSSPGAALLEPSTLVVLLLSPFSSQHGLFSSLLSIYFGKQILSHHEQSLSKPWMFFPTLAIGQLTINLLALQVDAVWFFVFPLGELHFRDEGWGGLFPIICFLEAAYSLSAVLVDGAADRNLPLPFSFSKPYRGLAYACIFSILKCGDVDLFCAAGLGYAWAFARQIWLGQDDSLKQCCARAGGDQEYTPLPTTGASTEATETEAERRALFLAATERRLNKI